MGDYTPIRLVTSCITRIGILSFSVSPDQNMAAQTLRKKRLEDKLGLNLNKQESIEYGHGFDQETIDIVWDVMNGKYDGLHEHPRIKSEPEDAWPNWVFFLVVHNTHAAIWAVEEQYMTSIDVVSHEPVSPFDVGECLKSDAKVRRYHVVLGEDSRYYVQPDVINLKGKGAEFDYCLYIGTLTLSLKGLNVLMAIIADKNYLLLESDCLEYCKQFVYIYFDLIETEMTEEQVTLLEKLTVTTNALLQASERSGRRNRSSGLSLRALLESTFTQVYVASILGGVSLFVLYKVYRYFR